MTGSTWGRRSVGVPKGQNRILMGARALVKTPLRPAKALMIACSLGGLATAEAGAFEMRMGDARSSLGGLCNAGPFGSVKSPACQSESAYQRSSFANSLMRLGATIGSFNTDSVVERTGASQNALQALPWKVPLQPDLGASKNMVLSAAPTLAKPFLKLAMYSAFYIAQPEASYVWRMNIVDEGEYQNAFELGLASPMRKQQANSLRGQQWGLRFVWKY